MALSKGAGAVSMKQCTVILPGGGVGYDWSADHTFVKVGAEHTDGAYTLMEDNLKSPSGFDGYLAELATMTEADFEDSERMAALNESTT